MTNIKTNDEHISEIVSKNKFLFKDGKLPRCGIDIPPGWMDLVSKLCSIIDHKLQYTPEDTSNVSVSQIKEKFGGLRFYMNGSTEYINGAIAMAEYLSEITCETCGNPGKRRSGSWIRTLCDDHTYSENLEVLLIKDEAL